jgi:hypothetical protein
MWNARPIVASSAATKMIRVAFMMTPFVLSV